MKKQMRLEIQGLRAAAVLLVIANHLTGWPAGGFVGVDVFFVVSGYVITRLLMSEAAEDSRVSLTSFYRRRVKRILPASALVLMTVFLVSRWVYSPSVHEQTSTDILWALGFAANWRFVALGTDYLHAGDAVSPIQHFWSLAVEEQFYFVWPLAVLVVVALSRRHRRRVAVISGALAMLIIGVSFVWAMRESVAQPTAAYFSTLTRGWELAVGCLLACSTNLTRRLPAAAQTPLAWLGLLGIFLSIVLIDTNSPFPAPSAALPVLATAVVIVAGERRELQNVYLLTNRASVWVGNLSYSLYLWHFPVLIFMTALFPDRGRKYLALSVILIAVLSLFSYYFIETPLRHMSWRPRLRSPLRTPMDRRLVRPAASVVALLLICTSVSAFALQTRPEVEVTGNPIDPAWPHSATQADADQRELVSRALEARSWPALEPAIMNPGVVAQAPEWVHDGCLGDERGAIPNPFQNALRCVYGDKHAKQTLAVVGDSHAISYVPGIRRAIGRTWRIEVYTLEECPAVWVGVSRGDGAPHPDCPSFQREVAAHLASTHPDVIMMTSSTVALTQVSSHATGDALSAEWKSGTEMAVRMLAPSTKRLVLVDDAPPTANLPTCYTALNGPGRCVVSLNPFYVQMVQAQRSAVSAVGARNVSYPSTTRWFCSEQGLCPAFIGRTPVTVDAFHLTDAMAKELAPLLRQVLVDPL